MQIRFLNVLNRQRKLSCHNGCINLEKKRQRQQRQSHWLFPPKKEKKKKITTKKSLKLQAQGYTYVPFWSIVEYISVNKLNEYQYMYNHITCIFNVLCDLVISQCKNLKKAMQRNENTSFKYVMKSCSFLIKQEEKTMLKNLCMNFFFISITICKTAYKITLDFSLWYKNIFPRYR